MYDVAFFKEVSSPALRSYAASPDLPWLLSPFFANLGFNLMTFLILILLFLIYLTLS